MNSACLPFIPPRTRAELANPAPHGERHLQMVRIAMSLIGNGLSPEAVFAELRNKYDHTVSDKEISDVVRWTSGRNPEPSGHRSHRRHLNSPPPRPERVTAASARANVEQYLKGFRCEAACLYHASSWRPLEDPALDSLLLLAGLFQAGELVNVCPEHGVGMTKTRVEWMAHIREHGTPSGSIGCLFRPNPVSRTPTGDKGGYTDVDITAHRYAVVESDILPLDLQLSVLARLPLPVAAIIFSGRKSYHALVRINAPDADAYRRDVRRMLSALHSLGFDMATGNPSRMSRLPGAMRGEETQRLIYLNPEATGKKAIYGGTK